MATRKIPPSRSRRGSRTPALLDPEGTDAPPHNDPVPPQDQVGPVSVGGGASGSPPRGGGFGAGGYGRGGFGGGFNTGAFNTQTFNAPGLPPSVQTPAQPPSAGTAPVISSASSGAEPRSQDIQLDSGPGTLSGDTLTFSGRTFRAFNRTLVTLHVRSLIEAFQEIEDYHPQRNVPPPPLWKDDKEYLDDIKALTRELRRLNDLLEAGKGLEAPEVKKTESAIVHAATKISDAAYDALGKGLGYVILGSVGLLLYSLGVPSDIVQLIMSAKGGK